MKKLKFVFALTVSLCLSLTGLKSQSGPNPDPETALNHICGFAYWFNYDAATSGSYDGTCETSHGIVTPSSVCALTVCCYNNFAVDQLTFGQPFYTAVLVSASGPNGPYADYNFPVVPGGGPTVVPFSYGPGVTYSLSWGGNNCVPLVVTPLCAPPGNYTLSPNPVCVGQPACLTFTTSMLVITNYTSTAPYQVQNCQANSFNNYTCFHCKTYSAAGIYTSTFTTRFWPDIDPEAKCKSSSVITVTVSPPIGAPTANSNPQIICRGQSAVLSANAIGATNYTWMPGGQTGSSIVVNPNITTQYNVIASNAGCTSNPAIVTVSVGNCCLQSTKFNQVFSLGNATIVPANTPNSVAWNNLDPNNVNTGLLSLPNAGYSITGDYNVLGNLTISTPVTFLNNQMSFDEASIVFQNSTTNINQSYWHGCTKNWQGIKSTKFLNVTNSVIEDASTAILVNTQSGPIYPGLNVDNTIFNKNYVGIYLLGGKINSFKVRGSIFTSRDIPVANYVYTSGAQWTNLSTFNSAGLSSYQTGYLKGSAILGISSANRGQTGIILWSAQNIGGGANPNGNLTIGDVANNAGTNTSYTNIFDYLKTGVVSLSSRNILYNNLFQNISTFGGIDPPGITAASGNVFSRTVIGNNQFGINNPQSALYKNTFLNCTIGVYATNNGTLTVSNNEFTNISNYGINIEKWYAAPNNNQPVTITNNQFNTCLIDLYAFDNSKIDLNFSDNISTYPFITVKPRVTHHVFIDEINKSKDAKYNVNFSNSVGKVTGVYCNNAYGAKINNNTLTVRTPIGNGFNAPIWLNNTDQSDIKVNTLNVNPSNSQFLNTFGIYTSIGVNNTYCENDIKGAGAAMKFQGGCPSKIYLNKLNNNPTDPCVMGIFLDNSGFVGPINFPFFGNLVATANNEFGDFNPVPNGYDTYLQNSSIPSQIDYDGAPFNNNPFYPAVNFPPPPFGMSPVFNNFSNVANCGAQQLLLQNISRGIPPFINNQLNFGSNNANTNAIASKGIFELFRKNAINTASISGAPAFMTANNSSAVGSFYQMDSLVQGYTTTRDTNKVAMASTMNTGLSPNGNIEQNQKNFNEVYHTYLLGDTLVTAVQLNTLKSIAALCPFTDGTNVYQARSLLRHYDTTEYYNTCEFTIPTFASSRFGQTKTELNSLPQAVNTKLFPNPASTEVIVTTDIQGAQLLIYSILGQLVLETNLSPENKLDISTFTNGTYFYKIVQDKTVIKADKLIINK